MSFVLAADTSGDIPRKEMRERNIEYIPLVFIIDGTEYPDNFSDDSEFKWFYDQVRAGKLPSTSQINVATHEDFFMSLVDKYDDDILYVTLSSGLSSSCESARLAAENVKNKTGRKIYVVDSLGATISQRHVVDEAERLRNAGATAAEAAEKLAEFVTHIQTWFMPTDLMHLKRGGRASGAAAYIGTALKIKPIIFIDSLGKLPVIKKVHGAEKGIAFMAKMFADDSAETPHKFYIASADSEYAEQLLSAAKAVRRDCEGEIGWIGPVIGAHTGCGAVGISFVSDIKRRY